MADFRIGGTMFTHADVVVKFTPYEGGNKGIPFRIVAPKSLDASNEGKAIVARGAEIEVVSLGMGESVGKWSLGVDVMQIATDYEVHCGPGAARMRHDAQIIFTRPSLAPITFHLEFMIIEKGFGGFKSESGAQPTNEFSGQCRKVLMERGGVKYDPFKLPAGSSATSPPGAGGGLGLEFGVVLEVG
ncbi:MAG TPA: hypothetical protein VLT47_10885 [Anaeromyxobacteraceae bacterium]|nr:hypothetical protein [Anaeromyxobacteraceae bacterium]